MMRLKSAFTLVEVNLAIFIMATGVLGMVSLYSLGFRESQQSREDVAASGYADAFFAPLVAGLSATNTVWSKWSTIGKAPDSTDGKKVCDRIIPDDGWGAYVSSANGDKSEEYRVEQNCNTTADSAFDELMNAAVGNFQGSTPSQRPKYYALVATRRGSVISLAFRSSQRRDQLMSQPLYYTEVHFQGDPNR